MDSTEMQYHDQDVHHGWVSPIRFLTDIALEYPGILPGTIRGGTITVRSFTRESLSDEEVVQE